MPNYSHYSIGEKEFQIQRVSVLQKNQDFVMVDNSQQQANTQVIHFQIQISLE